MTNIMALLAAIFIGALSTIQSGINTDLGKHIGGLTAALVSFLVGTITLAIFYLVSGSKEITGIFKVPHILLIGGFFGALFVYGMIKIIPIIGVSGSIAGVIAGQLILGMIMDHFGWFGLPVITFTFRRALAAILLIVSTILMKKL
jgi:transporter family-2 protein